MEKQYEYVIINLFATAIEIELAERKQAKLVAAGYILCHQSIICSTYRKPDMSKQNETVKRIRALAKSVQDMPRVYKDIAFGAEFGLVSLDDIRYKYYHELTRHKCKGAYADLIDRLDDPDSILDTPLWLSKVHGLEVAVEMLWISDPIALFNASDNLLEPMVASDVPYEVDAECDICLGR